MHLTTYVNFDGTCATAFRYYEQHLGGRVTMLMTHGQAPEPAAMNPEWKDAVLHARITIGEMELMGADIPGAEPMRSAYLTLLADSDSDAERAYTALSDGGRVLMRMAETFFAHRFGQVQDRFGVNWMILHERPMPSQP